MAPPLVNEWVASMLGEVQGAFCPPPVSPALYGWVAAREVTVLVTVRSRFWSQLPVCVNLAPYDSNRQKFLYASSSYDIGSHSVSVCLMVFT